MSVTHDDRKIPLEAVHNFRDLGGYRTADGRTTRWRTLYRADGLYRLTPTDIDTVRALGLTTVIDLRTPDELTERGRFPLDDHPAAYHHLPIIDVVWSTEEVATLGDDPSAIMLHLYLDMFRRGEQELVQLLQILARPEVLPAVFHCAAGKDRTGIASAVVLGVLGVPAETIVADYALSAEAMERMEAWFEANMPHMVERMAQQPQAFRSADPRTMEGLLDLIDARHGSMKDYVRSLGVGDDVFAALETNLLDD
ncbi:MAG: tyrosine-protein phosphatase [Acidimicrobiales bacterium]